MIPEFNVDGNPPEAWNCGGEVNMIQNDEQLRSCPTSNF